MAHQPVEHDYKVALRHNTHIRAPAAVVSRPHHLLHHVAELEVRVGQQQHPLVVAVVVIPARGAAAVSGAAAHGVEVAPHARVQRLAHASRVLVVVGGILPRVFLRVGLHCHGKREEALEKCVAEVAQVVAHGYPPRVAGEAPAAGPSDGAAGWATCAAGTTNGHVQVLRDRTPYNDALVFS
ncbi:hypothetical protein ACCO45_001900 [Purpureocillium lilacinum]|uniref:Uncharacterized protein n=1 Tax=Purpureocillium lilacinum TaxID=33203 RepID=A0ACC4E8V7_PURLI